MGTLLPGISITGQGTGPQGIVYIREPQPVIPTGVGRAVIQYPTQMAAIRTVYSGVRTIFSMIY